jgi:hypothetical protein
VLLIYERQEQSRLLDSFWLCVFSEMESIALNSASDDAYKQLD